MSVEYFIGLAGDLPNLRALDARFANLGGVDGDWARGIEIAGVGIHSHSDAEAKADIIEVLEQALRDADNPALPIATVLVVSHGPYDTVCSVAEVLVADRGGVLTSEDGDVIVHEPGPRELPPVAPRQALDLSIPPLVEQQFAGEQHLYALVLRREPSVGFGELIKQLAAKPTRVGHGGGSAWEASSIGQLVLKRYLAPELNHWSSELAAIGCESPTWLFRLSFEHWHVKEVPERDWRDMLAVVCGLGRATDGVLYRISAPGEAHFDFGPKAITTSDTTTSSSSSTAGATDDAPSKPRSKLVQYFILAIMLGICGGFIWLVRPSTGPCTVKQTFRNDNICIVSGTVAPIDQRNKELNAKRLGNIDLEEVDISDDTGTRSIYFDPTRISFAGRATARVTGKEVEERGSGVRRFVVSEVK